MWNGRAVIFDGMRNNNDSGISGIELIVSLIVLAFIALIGVGWNAAKCSVISTETGRATRYGIVSGCMVKTSDGWAPLANWRSED